MFTNGRYLQPVFQNERVSYPIDGTNDTMWEETYVQWRQNYARLALSTQSTRHANHFLISESQISSAGPENSPLCRFTRLFAMVPATRTEPVQVSYSFPSLSTFDEFGFHKCGLRDPVCRVVSGTNTFSYILSETAPAINPLTIPIYQGQVVDFIGPGWAVSGQEYYTTPTSEPEAYTVACQITRWHGQIWQKVLQTVLKPISYLNS
jgi:hypothetical protein